MVGPWRAELPGLGLPSVVPVESTCLVSNLAWIPAMLLDPAGMTSILGLLVLSATSLLGFSLTKLVDPTTWLPYSARG